MTTTYQISTQSPEETKEWAKRLGRHLSGGEVLVLRGDVGAGKTTFTQGLAQGLAITETVNSPTFTIVKEYEGRLPLFHVDAYRLDEEEELGLEEYFEGDGVSVIEWAERIPSQLPREYLEIIIESTGHQSRKLQFFPHGSRYQQLLETLFG